MHKVRLILFVLTLVFPLSCKVYKYHTEITDSDLIRHVNYLASDALQGRYPGTSGDEQAGTYISQRFKELGLEPQKQDFTFLQAAQKGNGNTMTINGQAVSAEAFSPMPFSRDTLVRALVVFAGYGMTVETDSFVWNDYAGLEVKGKWVMVLRGEPEIPGGTDYLSMASDDRDKAMLAGDKGASGILFVSGHTADPEDKLVMVTARHATVGIPALHISRATADSILRDKLKSIQEIENVINHTRESVAFATSSDVMASSDIIDISGHTANWHATLQGTDALLKDEYIIIGAHYDHLGMGGPGSSSRRPDTIAVHNGADDNASGVSAMLELAGKLKADQRLLKRSVIFVAFGAEEKGLLGSKYFVNHPPVELSKVVAMINLDMVGRLDSIKGIQVGGTGTSLEADSLIKLAHQPENLKLTTSREGSGPSDHSSFYGKNIPVFFITTGAHNDYHTPDDDPERIHIAGMNAVTHFVYRLVFGISDNPSKLVFREAGPRESAAPNYRFKVTLGFMPDFSATDVEGVRVDFVSKGKAAERGGIKNGDIITAIDGLKIKNIYDYMYRLSKLNKNQIISVEILRNGNKEVLIIQL